MTLKGFVLCVPILRKQDSNEAIFKRLGEKNDKVNCNWRDGGTGGGN